MKTRRRKQIAPQFRGTRKLIKTEKIFNEYEKLRKKKRNPSSYKEGPLVFDSDYGESNIKEESHKKISLEQSANEHHNGPLKDIEDIYNDKPILETEISCEIMEPDIIYNERVFGNVNEKWGYVEELFLLKSVEESGLFNWERIASQLSHSCDTDFSADEVQDHFLQYYIHGTLGQVWNYQLVENPVRHEDHTELDTINLSAVNKYLPSVDKKNLKEIRFFPHREEFEKYPQDEIEDLVTHVDFSSFYMDNFKSLNMEQEVKDLQLAVVDSYQRKVRERIEMYKFMKNFKLIEQYFRNELQKQSEKFSYYEKKKYELVKIFHGLQKFIQFFESPFDFLNFHFDCVKEKLLKLEINRLSQCLMEKKKKERNLEMKYLFKRKAPSFINVVLFLKAGQSIVVHRSNKRKKKFNWTNSAKKKRTIGNNEIRSPF